MNFEGVDLPFDVVSNDVFELMVNLLQKRLVR